MTEIWKDIEGYEGKYQVSNLGRLRSVDHYEQGSGWYSGKKLIRGKILKPQSAGRYLVIRQHHRPNITVHRAVAKAFVPGYFEGAEVNHKDENRMNNRWDNLEWVSHKDNMNYGTRTARVQEKMIEQRGVLVRQYDNEGNLVAEYPSIRAAANGLGVCSAAIQQALKRGNRCKGYHLKRIDPPLITPPTPITNRTTNAITNRTTTPINNRVPTPFGTHVK